ncbi:DNA-directed DNA polymerase [Spizellomyces sp. 'palustris']|nr:DNA-directed DNA polymerase [Spizellomyces sp. 'palustris']
MGFKSSKYFGHIGCAESITAIGRLFLVELVNEIEQTYPVKVIYGDTDSCMIWHKNEVSKEEMIDLANKICEDVTYKLPQPMALNLESYYDKVILLSKKRYIMVNENKLSYKGVMNARRDYCKYASNMYEDIMKMIAKGCNNDDITDYIDHKIFNLLSGKCDISDLIVTKSVGNLATYKVKAPHVVMARRLVNENKMDIPPGTRLEYVFVKGGRTQGEKMMMPDEVKESNMEIDGMFYIQKQLTSQIDDILSVIGLDNYIKNTYVLPNKNK